MRRPKLNSLESAFIFLNAGLFLLSIAVYVKGFSLWDYLFQIANDTNSHVKIGTISHGAGSVKRQSSSGAEFEDLQVGSPLFTQDIIVCGPNSSATIQFADGSMIDLAPNTMVRLAFHQEIAFGGIHKFGELNVVAGSVVAKTHRLKFVFKNQNRTFTITPFTQQSLMIRQSLKQQTPILSQAIALDPKTPPPPEPPPPPLPKLFPSPTPTITPTPTPSPTPLLPLAPVNLLPLLVSGHQTESNELRENFIQQFDIEIRWEKYKEAQEYRVWFGSSPKAKKPLLEKTVKTNHYFFNRGKIFVGQFYYRVDAVLKTGQIASSPTRKFSFAFLPPVPKLPANNTFISLSTLAAARNQLLISWQKTLFTEQYEIEIFRDHRMSRPLTTQVLTDNYFVMDLSQPGDYWWRVRGLAQDLSSPFSAPFHFTVTQ